MSRHSMLTRLRRSRCSGDGQPQSICVVYPFHKHVALHYICSTQGPRQRSDSVDERSPFCGQWRGTALARPRNVILIMTARWTACNQTPLHSSCFRNRRSPASALLGTVVCMIRIVEMSGIAADRFPGNYGDALILPTPCSRYASGIA